jgi:tetratricopeptide (TPR) repeat protein
MALREKDRRQAGDGAHLQQHGPPVPVDAALPEALENHHRSMQIRQELGDAEGVARSVFNLAWVHFEMTNLDHAEELAQRARSMSDEQGIAGLRAQAKGLLGEIHLARHRMPEARAALEEAVRELREVGDAAELFANLRKSASLELRSGDLQRAESLLVESRADVASAASPLEEANWHLAHADLRRAQGDPRRAAQSYEHAGNNLARLGNAQRAARPS